jgi:hypothetical protein
MPTPQSSSVSTLLKVYAPKEVGITLVPLQEVEQAEDSAMWSSFFLMILSLLLGTLLPLFLTDYKNTPVMWILGFVSLAFLILSVAFHCRTRSIRKKIRSAAVGPGTTNSEDGEDDEEKKAIKGMMMMFYAVHKHIFKGAPTLPKELFLKRVPAMFDNPVDTAFAAKVFDDLQKNGFIEAFDTEGGKLYVRPSLGALESAGFEDAKLTNG